VITLLISSRDYPAVPVSFSNFLTYRISGVLEFYQKQHQV
jgi:hypothetical protein